MQSFRTGVPARPIGAPWVAEAARDITALGSSTVLSTLTILVLTFLALSRRFSAALFLGIAAIGGQTLNAGLKALYGRQRPDVSIRWLEIDSLSFPSGHATSSAVVYLTLAVLLSRLCTTRSQRFFFFTSALILTGAVGFSRVYLGVHYPTDVIAGWALGIAWAEACWLVAQILGRRRLAQSTA
jgi:undecaprenyl-diphosphatase